MKEAGNFERREHLGLRDTVEARKFYDPHINVSQVLMDRYVRRVGGESFLVEKAFEKYDAESGLFFLLVRNIVDGDELRKTYYPDEKVRKFLGESGVLKNANPDIMEVAWDRPIVMQHRIGMSLGEGGVEADHALNVWGKLSDDFGEKNECEVKGLYGSGGYYSRVEFDGVEENVEDFAKRLNSVLGQVKFELL